jgi:hypothetical protein
MPPNTRASAISATAAEKLEKERVRDLTSEVSVNAVLSPNFFRDQIRCSSAHGGMTGGILGMGGRASREKSSQGIQVAARLSLAGCGPNMRWPRPPCYIQLGKTSACFELKITIVGDYLQDYAVPEQCCVSSPEQSQVGLIVPGHARQSAVCAPEWDVLQFLRDNK